MRFKLFKRKVEGPVVDARIDARDHQFTAPDEIIRKTYRRRKMTNEVVEDWSEACRWVEHAVEREAERLMREDNYSPEATLKAKTLRAAFKRMRAG